MTTTDKRLARALVLDLAQDRLGMALAGIHNHPQALKAVALAIKLERHKACMAAADRVEDAKATLADADRHLEASSLSKKLTPKHEKTY